MNNPNRELLLAAARALRPLLDEVVFVGWKHGAITLDVMPLDEKVLGFGNRWYRAAMQSAIHHVLARSVQIRMVTAPYFLATKLEAFKGRGAGDYTSHDLEDLLAVVDGREGLLEEVRADTMELREYLAAEIGALLKEPRFLDARPGHLLPDDASQARIPLLMQRLKGLSQVAGVDSK